MPGLRYRVLLAIVAAILLSMLLLLPRGSHAQRAATSSATLAPCVPHRAR
jgi:hypothetical protein